MQIAQTQNESKVVDRPFNQHASEDGVTHINIDARAATWLGQQLSHTQNSHFVHPVFGPFNSIEGLWAYLRKHEADDSLRYMSGMEAKRATKAIDKGRWVANFRQIILEANFFKIEQNEALKKAVIESTLPFDHYYIFESGLLIRPQIESWLIPGFEEIRKMLKEGCRPTSPDYTDALKRSAT